jgi:uncharacterized protein (TIGR02391 family)
MASHGASGKVVAKRFTIEEIDRGIDRFLRRILEVKALESQGLSYDNVKVKMAESNVRETIRDVFGSKSAEFHEFQDHCIWEGTYKTSDLTPIKQVKFRRGIPQTLSILQGLIDRLEEKKANLVMDPKGQATALFNGLSLHKAITEASRTLFRDGHYRSAVFEAAKTLIFLVKTKSGKMDLDGTNLMRTVFSRNNPVLAFNNLEDATDVDEQEGLMHLFEGAVQAVRNPRGHDFPQDLPEEALEYLILLSMLARRLEKANDRK